MPSISFSTFSYTALFLLSLSESEVTAIGTYLGSEDLLWAISKKGVLILVDVTLGMELRKMDLGHQLRTLSNSTPDVLVTVLTQARISTNYFFYLLN